MRELKNVISGMTLNVNDEINATQFEKGFV